MLVSLAARSALDSAGNFEGEDESPVNTDTESKRFGESKCVASISGRGEIGEAATGGHFARRT